MSNFWGRFFHVFIGKKTQFFFKYIVASALGKYYLFIMTLILYSLPSNHFKGLKGNIKYPVSFWIHTNGVFQTSCVLLRNRKGGFWKSRIFLCTTFNLLLLKESSRYSVVILWAASTMVWGNAITLIISGSTSCGVNRSSLFKWLLLQNCMKINGTTFFSLKMFPVIPSGPQKYKHKIGCNYFTF